MADEEGGELGVGDGITLIQQVNAFAGMLGYDSPLDQLFGGGNNDSKKLLEAFTAEVKALLDKSSFDNKLKDIMGTLDSARQFVTITYPNNLKSTMLPDERYNDIGSAMANPLSDSSTLGVWMTDETDNHLLPPAISIYLGLCVVICKLYQLQVAAATAAATPGAVLKSTDTTAAGWQGDKASAELNVRSQAKIAVGTMTPSDPALPSVMKIINDRIAGLKYWVDAPHHIIVVGQGHSKTITWAAAHMSDDWLTGYGPSELITWADYSGKGDAPDPKDYVPALARVWHAYKKVLWDGNADACTELKSALGDDKLRKASFSDSHLRDDYLRPNSSYDMVCSFGQWAGEARGTLMKLDLIATGLPGTQEDSWVTCSKCGLLYHGPSSGPCAAGGQHGTFVSHNFVVHRLPTTPMSDISGAAPGAPNTKTCFARCSKCHILQLQGGHGPCAAGGLHVSESGNQRKDDAGQNYTDSGNYFVCTGSPPAGDDAPVGIASVQEGWRMCTRCFGIYLDPGAMNPRQSDAIHENVCAAGGRHGPLDETMPIWMTTLGFWMSGFDVFQKAPPS
jgi:hypothetical protein